MYPDPRSSILASLSSGSALAQGDDMKKGQPFKKGHDFQHMADVLMRRTKQGPVPIFEGVVDAEIACEILGWNFPMDRVAEFADPGPRPTLAQMWYGFKLMRMAIAFYKGMGYDYVIMTPIILMPRTAKHLRKNPKQEDLVRAWQNEHEGLIRNREEFERFPWPSPRAVNMLPIAYTKWSIPRTMKVIAFSIGIFEDLRCLLGFEQLAIKSIEEPDLVTDILDKLHEIELAALEKCAAHPGVGAFIYADDLAFNNGTMLSPRWIRENLIPRYKRSAEIVHRYGKPFLFHSCGQVDAIMEDLIETVGIDARHSYQDNIEPVEEVYRKYHDRICIIGGLDVDLLARGSEDQVRKRTRQILEACAPGGGYVMGSGNSVTNYCKIENYFTMLDETRKWNEEN
jgi:uroporphyrinogen decarboxylase